MYSFFHCHFNFKIVRFSFSISTSRFVIFATNSWFTICFLWHSSCCLLLHFFGIIVLHFGVCHNKWLYPRFSLLDSHNRLSFRNRSHVPRLFETWIWYNGWFTVFFPLTRILRCCVNKTDHIISEPGFATPNREYHYRTLFNKIISCHSQWFHSGNPW